VILKGVKVVCFVGRLQVFILGKLRLIFVDLVITTLNPFMVSNGCLPLRLCDWAKRRQSGDSSRKNRGMEKRWRSQGVAGAAQAAGLKNGRPALQVSTIRLRFGGVYRGPGEIIYEIKYTVMNLSLSR
jgi:hypothetical protein